MCIGRWIGRLAAAPLAAAAVELSPCGDVVLREPPRAAVVQDANFAEMVVASGRPVTLWATAPAEPSRCVFWDRIPGFSPTGRVTFARGLAPVPGAGFAFDRELLLALRPDVLHIDPVQLGLAKGWSPEAVAAVRKTVAPFFANRFSRDFNPPRGVAGYRCYPIPELARRMGALYGAEARTERLLALVAEAEAQVAARLAGAAPPRVALLYYGGRGRMTPFRLGAGNGQAQYRVLGARDAYAGVGLADYAARGPGLSMDLETLLAVDPDVIVMPFAGAAPPGDRHARAFSDLLALRRHPLARRLRAFASGRVYPGGTPLQGPVVYLFQLEMAAKQLYPDRFGAWRADGAYPPDARLFDRAALADVLN